MKIAARLKHCWAVMLGYINPELSALETAADKDALAVFASIRNRIERLHFAAIIRELPMAFADDITTLDNEIKEALAAKDTAAADNVAALAAANDKVTALTAQVADQEMQLQALIAKYAPPAPTPAPAIDPATGQPVAA
jgi:hypothetical protein